jgi:hypothetical protein
LVHVGGFNSFGVNYRMPLGGNHWEALSSCHSRVCNQNELELTNNAAVYY